MPAHPEPAVFIAAVILTLSVAAQQAPPSPEAQAELARVRELQKTLPDTPGTGPFPAIKETDAGLPGQVIYRPENLKGLGATRLGVIAFGNGACSDDAASSRLHLLETASHGYLVIAPGYIYSGPGAMERPSRPDDGSTTGDQATPPPPATRPEQLRVAIDWSLAENTRQGSPYFGRIDPDAVAVSGFSCGGIQALVNAKNPRIKTAVIMNSGLFKEGVTRMGGMEVTHALLDDLHFPTLYVLGGPKDIAYVNGMHDFELINHVPVAVANIDKGHGGTYWEPDGGAAAALVVDWLNWTLRGDKNAGAEFQGQDCGLCKSAIWDFRKKGID